MKKYLQMPFSTREHMLSKDFELFYYNDKHITPLKEHSHEYFEFYFFYICIIYHFIEIQIDSIAFHIAKVVV